MTTDNMQKSNEIHASQAKVVVLGDARTGKSSLIHSLKMAHGASEASPDVAFSEDASSFTVIEIPSSDLENSSANVYLKFWEYSGESSERDMEVAFPGALFCIITLDIRAPETANNAFNHWLLLKEQHMPESFLFIVGTHLDFALQRRLQIPDICRACAQKDAMYIEISNYDGSNVMLLRRLLCQRINYMLKVRHELKRSARQQSMYMAQESIQLDEGKPLDSIDIDPSILERSIISSSVGDILASTIGLEQWRGFNAEKNNLRQFGERITSFINELTDGKTSLQPPEYVIGSRTQPLPRGASTIPEPDLEELRHLYEMMGLKLPPQYAVPSPAKQKKTIKIKVNLPHNGSDVLQIAADEAIEAKVYDFLLSHNIEENLDAMASKLINTARSLFAQEAAPSPSSAASSSAAKRKRCRVRVVLPSKQTIETIIHADDDPTEVARKIVLEHNLSMNYEHKIWQQLQVALQNLKM